MYSPRIQEVIKSYEWVNAEFVNGRLEQLYPQGIPEILINALTIFARGYNAGYAEKLKRDAEERKRKAKQ